MSPLTETRAIQRDAERIEALRLELIEEMNGLAPIDNLEPRCMECGSRENLWDSELCFHCKDQRKAAGCEQAYLDRAEREVA